MLYGAAIKNERAEIRYLPLNINFCIDAGTSVKNKNNHQKYVKFAKFISRAGESYTRVEHVERNATQVKAGMNRLHKMEENKINVLLHNHVIQTYLFQLRGASSGHRLFDEGRMWSRICACWRSLWRWPFHKAALPLCWHPKPHLV